MMTYITMISLLQMHSRDLWKNALQLESEPEHHSQRTERQVFFDMNFCKYLLTSHTYKQLKCAYDPVVTSLVIYTNVFGSTPSASIYKRGIDWINKVLKYKLIFLEVFGRPRYSNLKTMDNMIFY